MDETFRLVFAMLGSSGLTGGFIAFVGWWSRRKIEIGFKRAETDIANESGLIDVLKSLSDSLLLFANRISAGFDKMVSTSEQTHTGIHQLLTEMPIETNRRVGEVIQAVDNNGSALKEELKHANDKLDALENRFESLENRFASVEKMLEQLVLTIDELRQMTKESTQPMKAVVIEQDKTDERYATISVTNINGETTK